MPGSMIHLITSRKVRPNGSALFMLGNIAPDAVEGKHKKDATHFRDRANRLPALLRLAEQTTGDFAEGVLLHLYLDWQWDAGILPQFIEQTGGDWFQPYRHELWLTGSYAFHHLPWAGRVWRDMDDLPVGAYGQTPGASPREVKDYLSHNHQWNLENDTGPSAAFPPDLIDEFTDTAAKNYAAWRKTIGK